jgi:hypothetical protein
MSKLVIFIFISLSLPWGPLFPISPSVLPFLGFFSLRVVALCASRMRILLDSSETIVVSSVHVRL